MQPSKVAPMMAKTHLLRLKLIPSKELVFEKVKYAQKDMINPIHCKGLNCSPKIMSAPIRVQMGPDARRGVAMDMGKCLRAK